MNTLQLRPRGSDKAPGALSPLGMLSALTLYLGFGGCLLTLFSGEHAPLLPLAVGVAAILLESLLRRTRFGRLTGLAALCASFAAALLFGDLVGGLGAVLNRMGNALGARLAYILPRFTATESAEPLAQCALMVLLALSCVWTVRARASSIAWLAALILVLPDVLLGLSAPDLWIAALVCGLVLLRLPGEMQLRCSARVLAAGLCILLVFSLAGSVLPLKATLSSADALRSSLQTAVQRWRFGSAEDAALPRGDFAQLRSLRQTDAPMLEITMSRAESLYLRGYVGSEYDGSGWRSARPESLRDGAELFYWLHRGDFYGETQLSSLAALTGSAEEPIELTVRPIGEPSDILYAPYELIRLDGALPDPNDVGDIRLRRLALRGAESYRLTASENLVSRYAELSRALAEAETAGADDALSAYLSNESHYNRYVYAHFLDMPESARALMQTLFGPVSFGESAHMDYGRAKQRVLDWLSENVQYSETPSPYDPDTDFLEDFLTQTKAGSGVHYAAAAALMMRYFGIPARYVEGYLITPDRAAAILPNEPFTLTQADAHAWAEIYQDGVGWIPFEVAPGYLNLMPQEDRLSGTGAVQSTSQPETPDDAPLPENSLDMTEDYHEDPDESSDAPKEARIWMLGLPAALALLLLVLLGLPLHRWAVRARWLRQYRLKDRRKAVLNLYADLFLLMQRIYRWPSCVTPSDFEPTIRADLGDDMAAKYARAMDVCRRAAFSDEPVSETDYLFVYHFVLKTLQLARKRLPRRKFWSL